jgi:EmrB/QacA subfamily drug resistance transporter
VNPTSAERYRLRWVTLGAIILTSFVGTWDGSAPLVALPAITREFGVGIDTAVWVLTIDSLLFAVPMAIFGKLGDMFGHRRIYLMATGGFALTALLAGLASSFGWLIFFRALQGICSSPAFTATMALIATTFPGHERGRAMGIMSMAASLAWATGPVIGGLLMQWFSWRAIIHAEIPVALVALALAWRLMPQDSRRSQPQFDVLGAASLTASVLTFMFTLRMVGVWGWADRPTLALGLLSLGLLGIFLLTEARVRMPFVPLNLFANAQFTVVTIFSVVHMFTLFGTALLIPVFLQEVKGYTPAQAGLLVVGLSVARIFFEPLAGRVAEVRGSRLPSLAGTFLIASVALSIALALTATIPDWVIAGAAIALGIGISMGRTPVNTAVTHLVEAERLGLALGVFSMLTFTGGSLGQAFFGVLLRGLSGTGNSPLASAPQPTLVVAFSMSFGVIAGVALLASFFGLRLPGREMVGDVVAARS